MIKGEYRCCYCGDVCNEQGIKSHIATYHKKLFAKFKYSHLNKFPLGHKLHADEQETLNEFVNFKDAIEIEELQNDEEEETIQENLFETEQKKIDADVITKDDLLGVTQTEQVETKKPDEEIIQYNCGTCGAIVKENDEVCKNCNDKLNWAEVE